MCEIFIRANPHSYDSLARSLRLHGVATSVRLECLFWEVLEEIGQRDGLTVNQLISKLYDELLERRGEVANFASFLRVCCLRYLKLQQDGRIPADTRVSISSLDAATVLDGLPPNMADAPPPRRSRGASTKSWTTRPRRRAASSAPSTASASATAGAWSGWRTRRTSP